MKSIRSSTAVELKNRSEQSSDRFCVLLAEREGFEPSVQLPVQRFSRPPHSTALASLLWSLFQIYQNYPLVILTVFSRLPREAGILNPVWTRRGHHGVFSFYFSAAGGNLEPGWASPSRGETVPFDCLETFEITFSGISLKNVCKGISNPVFANLDGVEIGKWEFQFIWRTVVLMFFIQLFYGIAA